MHEFGRSDSEGFSSGQQRGEARESGDVVPPVLQIKLKGKKKTPFGSLTCTKAAKRKGQNHKLSHGIPLKHLEEVQFS